MEGGVAFALITVFALTTVSIDAFGFSYKESNGSAGIIFIPTNDVQLTYDEWHLCYYYDIEQYYLETNKIEECVQHLKTVCDEEAMAARYATQQLCHAVIKQFDAHLGSIKVKDEIIRSFRTMTHRTRRVPLEFVGGVLSALFGVLDRDDALRYANEIEKLKQSKTYETELLKQQTSIVEGSIRMNNYSVHELRERIADFHRDTNALKEQWFKSDSDFHLRTHFNLLSHVDNLILIHHNEMAETIINLLSNTIHGRMTNLIPTTRLTSKLTDIAKELGKNQELPINLDRENVFQLFSISKIGAVLHENKIIVEINFPILTRESYKLYHAVSIPAELGENFVVISPTSEYFLTSTDQICSHR